MNVNAKALTKNPIAIVTNRRKRSPAENILNARN